MIIIDFKKQAEDIGIDVNSLLSLYSLFLEQTENDIILIESYISQKDSKSIRDVNHHIKGASLNLELYAMVEASQKISGLLDEKSWDEISIEVSQFSNELNELKSILDKVAHE